MLRSQSDAAQPKQHAEDDANDGANDAYRISPEPHESLFAIEKKCTFRPSRSFRIENHLNIMRFCDNGSV